MQLQCSKTTIALLTILLFLVATSPSLVWAGQNEAANAISSAKTATLNCYNAAKDAEAAGANITTIVRALNEAGSQLSQAEFAYNNNDFDAATTLALKSQNSLSNVLQEANALKQSATQHRNQDFLINVVGSVVGAFAVIVAGFAVWFYLKRKYKTVGAP